MSGSGNDFVFVDARDDAALRAKVRDPDFVRELCAPHTGVGADGLAALLRSDSTDFSLLYVNRDGTVGELCGNASLCATRLAVELGVASPEGLAFDTDAGVIRARFRDGEPEIDLQPPTGVRPNAGIEAASGEVRIGFANTGVPHLVIRTTSVDSVPLETRGPLLRHHPSLPAGANVNWVAPDGSGAWRMRTYERGVEGETLACGTGAVAAALLLSTWGETTSPVRILTTSNRTLTVTLRETPGGLVPSLAGEGRIVFDGELREA